MADVIKSLGSLPPVWGIETVKYADFVLPMPRTEKVKVGNVTSQVPTWKLYMQVAGRVKMLNDMCDLGPYSALEELTTLFSQQTGANLPMMQTRIELLKDDVLVRRAHGLATVSKGDAPWEKAETAARGRALGALGIGVLPGTGIASLDEMLNVDVAGRDLTPKTREIKDRPVAEIIEAIIETKEELRQLRDIESEELDENLASYVQKAYGLDIRSEDGLKWDMLNKGKLLLAHSSLVQQRDKEKSDA